ncbi:MAG: acyl-CoA/acyl-ACP dehydrogenase [Candidatus Helarchaeota archaeon]|nr:acyl-CoA/acyl-ACP dehydrogenase [Candidatus Helarchaeota archaeon]
MEDLFFSDHEIRLQREIRDFLKKELEPIKEKINKNDEIPLELIRKIGNKGYYGPLISKQYGGTELGMINHMIITEEISRLNVAVSVTRTPCILDGITILRYGTKEQKEKYLPAIARAEKICAICITEKGAGTDVAGIETKAEKKGGEFIINGSKRFITNTGLADYYLVWALTNQKVNPRDGLSIFLVEKDTPGFKTENPYGLMGLRGVKNGTLEFENVHVPEQNLIGEENKGFQMLMKTFNVERLTLSSECNGISLAAFEASKKYAKERVQFGKKIATFQAIRLKIAKMATELHAARLLTYSSSKLWDLGKEITKEASMSKAFSSKTAVETTTEAVQVHGGDGYTDVYPVERYMRDAKFFQIGGGTSEIQNLIIAREELK